MTVTKLSMKILNYNKIDLFFFYLCVFCFLIANFLDVATTYYALSIGLIEANILVKELIMFDIWIPFKIISIFIAIGLSHILNTKFYMGAGTYILGFVTMYLLYIALNNSILIIQWVPILYSFS